MSSEYDHRIGGNPFVMDSLKVAQGYFKQLKKYSPNNLPDVETLKGLIDETNDPKAQNAVVNLCQTLGHVSSVYNLIPVIR